MLLIDLDRFKDVNDSHGHMAGDAVLREIGALLDGFGRADDYAARMGGEEFIVLLQRITTTDAYRVAERLRLQIAELAVDTPTGPIGVTASIGVVTGTGNRISTEGLLDRADQALYRSKRAGRNHTTVDEL